MTMVKGFEDVSENELMEMVGGNAALKELAKELIKSGIITETLTLIKNGGVAVLDSITGNGSSPSQSSQSTPNTSGVTVRTGSTTSTFFASGS